MEGTMLWFNPLKRHVPLFGERRARMRGRR
jgi:hypothetical protein